MAWLACGLSLSAALTEEQRVQDLQSLAALYAKSYGPANWKQQALGINLFDLRPWVARVRAAKDDLEHAQVLMEYTASLQDGHVSLSLQSTFNARLGFHSDIYEGKVYIDLITRSLLPAARYPFQEGDELVSVDGKPALELAAELARTRGFGNPRGQLRLAAARISSRSQSVLPRAVELGANAEIVVRRQSTGALETYTLPWIKTGFGITNLGSAPNLMSLSSGLQLETSTAPATSQDPEEAARLLFESVHQSVASRELWTMTDQPEASIESGSRREMKAVLNVGSNSIWYTPPAGFRVRTGLNAGDPVLTATYMAEGRTIGFLRIPTFASLTNAQLIQIANEIVALNAITDGLIVDVMRNPGGSTATVAQLAQFLIPGSFRDLGYAFRPYLERIALYDSIVSQLQALGAPQWQVDIRRFERDELATAFNNGRGMTGPMFLNGFDAVVPSQPFAYTKPMIVLIDDFSSSGADAFPAVLQDNKRAKLVGVRTSGLGGPVLDYKGGPWSETNTRVTVGMMVRSEEREIAGFPKSAFIENVGVRPDIELDFMTVENLLTDGKPFTDAYTRIILDEIRAGGARP
jgi:hypothetical protein